MNHNKESNKCKICFEKEIINKNLFICTHKLYCKECIDNWLKKSNTCPYCRAKSINNSKKRILVWHHEQILPATVYKKYNRLDYNIIIINSINEKKDGDILYNF